MRHFLGINEFLAKRKNMHVEVNFDSEELINNHILFAGMSGSGKSYQIINLLSRASLYDYEMDIFDVHEELSVPESSSVKYSSYNGYGYNPLIINPDLHSGGVRNTINNFISLINDTSTKLGSKQQSALRYLLEDLYAAFGIFENDPNSWRKPEDKQPSIDNLIDFNKNKLLSMQLGTDSIASIVRELASEVKAIKKSNARESLIKQQSKAVAEGNPAIDQDGNLLDENEEETQIRIEGLRQDAVQKFELYVNTIGNSTDIEDLYKYNNKDVLSSLNERLVNIKSSGIFNHNPPRFTSNKRCHELKSLSDDEQRLFVYMRLQDIFRKARDMGPSPTLRHIIVLDEAHKFFVEDGSNIINIISKEGRKYGLGLWAASQSPTHFSNDFLTNCGTILLLGIHSSYWDLACRKLKIKLENLKFVKAKKIATVKLQKKGEADPQFQNIVLESYLPEFLSEFSGLKKL